MLNSFSCPLWSFGDSCTCLQYCKTHYPNKECSIPFPVLFGVSETAAHACSIVKHINQTKNAHAVFCISSALLLRKTRYLGLVYKCVSYDVIVIQWITSCQKKSYDHTLLNILTRTCNVITTSVTTLRFLIPVDVQLRFWIRPISIS